MDRAGGAGDEADLLRRGRIAHVHDERAAALAVGSFHEFRYAKPLWYATSAIDSGVTSPNLPLSSSLPTNSQFSPRREVTGIAAVLLLFDLADHQDR